MSFYKKQVCIICNDGIEKPTVKGMCQYHYKLSCAKRYAAKNHARGSEYKLFEAIWEKREHICFLTNERLSDKSYYLNIGMFHNLFHHVLPKGKYPNYRLKEENIIILFPHAHHEVETIAISDMLKKYPRYKLLLDLKETLIQKYNGTDI